MTNLEMLLTGTKEDMQKRSDALVLHSLVVMYAVTFFSGKSTLQKAWKLNDISTNILSAPAYVLPRC